MTLEQICTLDVQAIAAPDCLLALWWVAAMPAEALEVARRMLLSLGKKRTAWWACPASGL